MICLYFDGGFRASTKRCGCGAWAWRQSNDAPAAAAPTDAAASTDAAGSIVFEGAWRLGDTAVVADEPGASSAAAAAPVLLTNNVAEYMGLIKGLETLLAKVPEADRCPLRVLGDSKLVIEQCSRRWAIRAEHLQVYADAVWRLIAQWGQPVTLSHIPRAQNTRADALAGRACTAL